MIKIINLFKRYKKNEVFKGLNLEIQDGEILVILGRSGVGKSVLLRHIMGLEKPDEGTIEIDGQDLSKLKKTEYYEVIKNMGMLFQGCALFDSLSIEENIAFYLNQHPDPKTKKPYKKEEIAARVGEALHLVGLEGIEKKMPSDLSGGMKKRAGLARLVAYHPKILLYDEPTTGLDPISANQINELIIKTQSELKGTSVIVTHDLHAALFVADRIAMISEEGTISHIADPDKFLEIDDPIINFLKKTLTYHPRTRKEQHHE